MRAHIQLVAIGSSVILLLVVLELVRRRRLFERYAILWLLSSVILLVLSTWSGLLGVASTAVGIKYPPTTLFLVALGFILVLLLHFSVAVSRLSDQSKVLAQRLALVEERLRNVQGEEATTVAEAGADAVASPEPADGSPGPRRIHPGRR